MDKENLHYKCLECGEIDCVVVSMTMGWNGDSQDWENLYDDPMDIRCQCDSWDVETFRGEYEDEEEDEEREGEGEGNEDEAKDEEEDNE